MFPDPDREKERPVPFDPNDYEHQQDRYRDLDRWVNEEEEEEE